MILTEVMHIQSDNHWNLDVDEMVYRRGDTLTSPIRTLDFLLKKMLFLALLPMQTFCRPSLTLLMI